MTDSDVRQRIEGKPTAYGRTRARMGAEGSNERSEAAGGSPKQRGAHGSTHHKWRDAGKRREA